MTYYLLIHVLLSIITYIVVRHIVKGDGTPYNLFDRRINLTFSIFFSWIWLIILIVLTNEPKDPKYQKEVKW